MKNKKIAFPGRIELIALISLSFAVAYFVFIFAPLDTYFHNPQSFVVGWRFLVPQLILFTVTCSVVIAAALVFASIVLLTLKQTSNMNKIIKKRLLKLAPYIVIAAHAGMAYLFSIHLSAGYLYLMLFLDFALILRLLLKTVIKKTASWHLLKKQIWENAISLVTLLILGLYLAAYTQVLFLNGKMSQITGEEAIYTMSFIEKIANISIWVAVAMLPLSIWIVLRKTRGALRYDKAVLLAVLVVVGMQTAGLVVTAVTAETAEGVVEYPQYLSYVPIVDFGEADNVVVFLLDFLDGKYIEELFDKYPEVYSQLNGFTFYENNVSEYHATFPSITRMLTQYENTEGLEGVEYWEDAWAQNTLIGTLKENGYTVNLLIDRSSTYSSFMQLQGRADNIRIADGIKPALVVTSRYMRDISFSRMVPYFLKNYFLRNLHPAFGNELFEFVYEPHGSAQQPVVGAETDLSFYEYIRLNRMAVYSDIKVFNFIHLNGAHPSNSLRYDDEADAIFYGGDQIESLRSSFAILDAYFEGMRAIDIYDDSTIIIIGDHGGLFSTHRSENPAVTTGLLIKTPGANNQLERNNQAELSHRNFGASVLEAAGIPHDRLGLSYFDIISGNIPQVRYFYTSVNALQVGGVFEIVGDANDFANWRQIR